MPCGLNRMHADLEVCIGEQGMKEDFIVVHLREPCSFCRKYISGSLRCAPPSRKLEIPLCSSHTAWLLV